MDLYVTPDRTARFGIIAVPCAIGRGGITPAKREGDGATPSGGFMCRWLYWRADRIAEPKTGLARRPLRRNDGWCDDPDSSRYNRYVELPSPDRHEVLWRDDAVYDLIVVLGYNDAPVVKDRGSAIFLHVARDGFEATEGCVALALPDLRRFLAEAGPGSRVIVSG